MDTAALLLVIIGALILGDAAMISYFNSLYPEALWQICLIYMLGFLPGFCYLGGLDERIHTPRLASPRIRIREGSVGIGGNATGIYPMDSPGGWQLMGMTPVKTFDPNREVPILLEAGQYIRFIPIGEDEFHEIRAQVEKGEYECVIHNEGSPDPGSGAGEGGE